MSSSATVPTPFKATSTSSTPIPKLDEEEKYKLLDFIISRQAAFTRCFSFLVGEFSKWKSRGSSRENPLGTIMEFGVWNGDSLLMIWKALQRTQAKLPLDWKMIGFDSFQGLPAGVDAADESCYVGSGSFCSSGKQFVADRLLSKLVPAAAFELVEGWYDKVLTEELKVRLNRPSVCFVNIDVDYYSSTMAVLNWVEDLLFDGAMLYFDDVLFYNGNPQKGQLKAIADFNAARSNSGLFQAMRFDPCGRVYLYWRNEDTKSEQLQF